MESSAEKDVSAAARRNRLYIFAMQGMRNCVEL